MAVSFKFTHDIEAVYAQLTDPDFLVERAIALGDLEADASVEETDDGTIVNMSREMVNDLPAFTHKIMGHSQTITLEETWQNNDEGKTAVYTNQIVGKPINMRADIALSTTASGCRYHYDATVNIKIPIIGRKLGGLIAGKTDRQITEECQYLSDYLDTNT